MKIVKAIANVDLSLCVGCRACAKVCPTDAITFESNKAVVSLDYCAACGGCVEQCPKEAISMIPNPSPHMLFCNPDECDQKALTDLCGKAHMFPKLKVCGCTGTTAGEVAAAILKGAKNPIEIARMTGLRTGCKCICAEVPLRLLAAAGIDPGKAPGYQWYGVTATAWTLSEEVKEKYGEKYYLDSDLEFYDEFVQNALRQEESV